MRTRWILGVGGALALLLVTLVVVGARGGSAQDEAPSRLFEVRRGDVRVTVRDTGTLEPLVKVEVKSKVAGRLVRFFVEEGEPVSRGQLLAQIDATEVRAQVRQINAQIDAAQARLRQAKTQLALERQTAPLVVADAEEELRSSQARLAQVRRQAAAQPSLSRATIDQAKANCDAAREALAALKDTHRQAKADARSALDQANAQAENAARHLKRMEALLSQGFVSQNQLDTARRDFDQARAQQEAAQERWRSLDEQHAAQLREAQARVAQMEAALATANADAVQVALRQDELRAAQAAVERAKVACERAEAARAQVQAREAEVAAAEAGVKQLKDQLAEIEVRLEDTSLRAPMAGVVTKRYLQEGELVTSAIASFSSGTPVMQIADLSRMRAVCQINEVDVGKVNVGQKATIVLDAAREQTYPGRVVSVAAAAGGRLPEGTGASASPGGIVKFEVRVAVERVDERLKPGMSAAVDIVVAERRGVLVLPLEAVEENGKEAFVTVLRGEKQEKVAVKTGLRNEQVVEILSGVKEGERVLPAAYRGVPRKRLNLRVGAQGEN